MPTHRREAETDAIERGFLDGKLKTLIDGLNAEAERESPDPDGELIETKKEYDARKT